MISQTDVIITEMLQQGLEDIRQNPWLIDDVFSQFKTNPFLAKKYGEKEIQAAKDWFLSNKIEVLMKYRLDKDTFPSITVAVGSSSEKPEMRHLGDLSSCVENLVPSQINKPIPFILTPFVPESFDSIQGKLVIPSNIKPRAVRPYQILVNPDTGEGAVIEEVKGREVFIEPGLEINLSKAAVVPKYQYYRVRREHTFFQEQISIGCHVHGDPASLLFLHSITLYLILRYREGLLEAKDFAESSVSSTDIVPNNNYGGPGGELVFSRYINLTGQVENSWLKTPRRVIEAIELEDVQPDGIKSGIKILSNLDSIDALNTEDDLWVTVKDDVADTEE